MSKRWKVRNVDYEWADEKQARLERMESNNRPWEAYTLSPDWQFKPFATHAEAITYADKQARRTT